MVLIYISTLERLESENPRTSLFYLFNYSLSLIVKTKTENILYRLL